MGMVLFLLSSRSSSAQEVYGPPVPWKDFKEGCIFLGIAKKGEALVALYFRKGIWTPRGVTIKAILVPTEKFPFVTGYRGFQKKADYRIKEGKSLRLTYRERMATFSLAHHVDIGDTTPILIEFVTREKREEWIPDDLNEIQFDVKDVKRWVKAPKKELPMWSRSFEELDAMIARMGMALGTQQRRIERGAKPAARIDTAEYRGRYVTLNGTYIFEKKTVYSPIIAVLDVGTYLEHTKPVTGGWMEVLYGDSKKKGFVLSVYLVDGEEEALDWEREHTLTPVVPPLKPYVPEEDKAGLDSP
jgi:hypothetical protein